MVTGKAYIVYKYDVDLEIFPDVLITFLNRQSAIDFCIREAKKTSHNDEYYQEQLKKLTLEVKDKKWYVKRAEDNLDFLIRLPVALEQLIDIRDALNRKNYELMLRPMTHIPNIDSVAEIDKDVEDDEEEDEDEQSQTFNNMRLVEYAIYEPDYIRESELQIVKAKSDYHEAQIKYDELLDESAINSTKPVFSPKVLYDIDISGYRDYMVHDDNSYTSFVVLDHEGGRFAIIESKLG